MQAKNPSRFASVAGSLIALSFFVTVPAHALTTSADQKQSLFSFCFSTEQEDPVVPFLKPMRDFFERHLGVTSHICDEEVRERVPANISSYFSTSEQTVGDLVEKVKANFEKSLFYKAIQAIL